MRAVFTCLAVLVWALAWPRSAAADEEHLALWHAYRGDEERALLDVVHDYDQGSASR